MVYGLYVISPVIGFLATVIPEKLASQELDASTEASGPHDFAVRLRRCSSRAHRRPPHPRPTSVTIAKRPSVRDGMGRVCRDDLPDRKSGFCPSGCFAAAEKNGRMTLRLIHLAGWRCPPIDTQRTSRSGLTMWFIGVRGRSERLSTSELNQCRHFSLIETYPAVTTPNLFRLVPTLFSLEWPSSASAIGRRRRSDPDACRDRPGCPEHPRYPDGPDRASSRRWPPTA